MGRGSARNLGLYGVSTLPGGKQSVALLPFWGALVIYPRSGMMVSILHQRRVPVASKSCLAGLPLVTVFVSSMDLL